MGPAQSPIQWVQRSLSLWVKWPGCEADHSPPSIAEVKNAQSYISTNSYVIMVWCLAKYRVHFKAYLCLFVSRNKKKSKDPPHKMSVKHHIRDQMSKVRLNDLEKAAKEECLFRNLCAYLEACVRI